MVGNQWFLSTKKDSSFASYLNWAFMSCQFGPLGEPKNKNKDNSPKWVALKAINWNKYNCENPH